MCQTALRAALAEYGTNLTLEATGAIEKKGKTEELRVIYDGSSGIPPSIRESGSESGSLPDSGRRACGDGGVRWGQVPASLPSL